MTTAGGGFQLSRYRCMMSLVIHKKWNIVEPLYLLNLLDCNERKHLQIVIFCFLRFAVER